MRTRRKRNPLRCWWEGKMVRLEEKQAPGSSQQLPRTQQPPVLGEDYRRNENVYMKAYGGGVLNSRKTETAARGLCTPCAVSEQKATQPSKGRERRFALRQGRTRKAVPKRRRKSRAVKCSTIPFLRKSGMRKSIETESGGHQGPGGEVRVKIWGFLSG